MAVAPAPPTGFFVARPIELRDAAKLHAFLSCRPAVNAFQLGWLLRYGVLARGTGLDFAWLGAFDGDRLCAAALLAGSTVGVLSHATPAAARPLGARIGREAPTLRVLVGPADAADVVADACTGGATPRRRLAQRLFVLDDVSRLPEAPPVDLKHAGPKDRDAVVAASLHMAEDDAGVPLAPHERTSYVRAMETKLDERRVWSVRRDGQLAFTASAALSSREAVQLEGVFVPPAMRGQGIATAAMTALCHRLLEGHRRVSLYANEASPAAMALYDRVGFRRADAFATVYL